MPLYGKTGLLVLLKGQRMKKEFCDMDNPSATSAKSDVNDSRVRVGVLAQAKEFCAGQGFCTAVAVLVDFSRPSCEPRFFVYSFSERRVVLQSLCAHGQGGGSTVDEPVFSNAVGSECSSLGRFLISGYRRMNTLPDNCFELDGLDADNSNARRRLLLIHPYWVVDDYDSGKKQGMIPIGPVSRGCFTISHRAMSDLEEIYEAQANKRILLWAYV